MVKRWKIQTGGDEFIPDGEYVEASEYDALAAELAEVTRQRDAPEYMFQVAARVKELEALVRRFKALSVDDGDEIHDQIWEDANKLVPQSETELEGQPRHAVAYRWAGWHLGRRRRATGVAGVTEYIHRRGHMSLWHCPEHGLTGPTFCCIKASLAQIDTVGGIESFMRRKSNIDTADDLSRCPFCGHEAGYYEVDDRGDKHPLGVICTNTSCGVKTPQHYQNRLLAAQAWNRRTANPGAHPK